ncbi:unnamed protein product [Lactuca saligna]|uniref:Uncharacterized protein n=1 Tax=Lactuca saligna TaxID=75948 RepID=A0AA35V3B6_LACSI|nr:unnamed protein product [Lactuca saligna]
MQKLPFHGEPIKLKLEALLLLVILQHLLLPRKALTYVDKSVDVQSTTVQNKNIQLFNNNMDKQHRISELNDRINIKKFGDVLARRSEHDPIIRVRCTKPRNESLKLHFVRKKTGYEYTEVILPRELVKFGYSKWIQIREIIGKHKGIHAQVVKLAIQKLLNKVKKLNLVPSVGPSRPSTSGRTVTPRGVEPIQHMFIREPEHGIFYLDSQNRMCFQRYDDLPAAPTEHLFHLRMVGLSHLELETG